LGAGRQGTGEAEHDGGCGETHIDEFSDGVPKVT
jgi:hypothetical protein